MGAALDNANRGSALQPDSARGSPLLLSFARRGFEETCAVSAANTGLVTSEALPGQEQPFAAGGTG